MKIYIKSLVLFLLIVSCQSNKKETTIYSANTEKETISKKNNTDDSKDIKPKKALTKEQLTDFFPKEIGAYKLIDVSVLMPSGHASAVYIQGNNYNHNMTYSLQDGNTKGLAELKNFEISYRMKPQGPAGTEYIYTERDGYKTIAFLQSKIKRNDIRFIYNNRFRMTLEGTDDVETLWSYFQKEDLKKLDNY